MEVPKDLQLEISINQNQLKNAIRNHQILVWKLKDDPNNSTIKQEIQAIHEEIIEIGNNQKHIIDRLRKTLHHYDPNLKNPRSGLEEKRFNFSTVLQKTRKQTIVPRSTSLSSFSASDDSLDGDSRSDPQSPVSDYDLGEPNQEDFMAYFGLCTPEVYKEQQKKRAERKRRSTANPHFLYGNHWDYSKIKRKKNHYLQSNFSPPNTRSAMRKQREGRIPSPPVKTDSRSTSPVSRKSTSINLNIPNLPSGLTIERVEGNSSSPEPKTCNVCHFSGKLLLCERCDSSFHISCHNRPLAQPPKLCPRCVIKKDKEQANMTVLVSTNTEELKEKLCEKRRLLEENKSLTNQLNYLEDRHAELTVSLKTQEETKAKLLVSERSAKEKIQRILDFVNNIKGTTATCEVAEGS